MNIAESIKFYRTKMNIKQEDMFPKGMFSASTLSKIENGTRSIKVEELQILLDNLSITFEEFFNITEFDKEQDKFLKDFYDCAANTKNPKLKTKILKHWNALYIEKAIEQLQNSDTKKEITEEKLQLLSPLISEHINFVGKYSFKYNEQLKDGEFRPLRQ